jgi:hypothetical protein
MSSIEDEEEVSTVEYVGPHPVRPQIYEITVTLRATSAAPRTRLSLLFRPNEARILAHMLASNPPEPPMEEDHVLTDITRVQT